MWSSLYVELQKTNYAEPMHELFVPFTAHQPQAMPLSRFLILLCGACRGEWFDTVDDLFSKISNASKYDDVAWLLDEPVKNFSQAIVDEALRKNVDFQGKIGLSAKIIRVAEAKCLLEKVNRFDIK